MGVRHASKELDKERDRLRAVYAAMTDAEFEEVANDADSLTEVARATLRAEMLRRGMEAPRDTNSEVGEALTSSSETGDCWAVSGSSRGNERSAGLCRDRRVSGLWHHDQAGWADLERSPR